MKKLSLLVLVLILALAGLGSALAQDTAVAPIVLGVAGDIYRYDVATGVLTQLSNWGYNGNPILSPDGRTVAYTSVAQFAVQQFESGEITHGSLPTNIWLLDIFTGDGTRIADQPDGAAVIGENAHAIYRSAPAWSPDGALLAWAEAETPGWQWQLVMADVSTGAIVTLAELPAPYADAGFFGEIPTQWDEAGIAVAIDHVDAFGEFVKEVRVFDPSGGLIGQKLYPYGTDQPYDWFWINEGSRHVIYMVSRNEQAGGTQVQLWDPATDEGLPFDPGAEVPMLQAADLQGPVSAYYELMTPADYLWWAVDPAARHQLPIASQPYGQRDRISPSPDGQALAFITDALYVWRDGMVRRMPGTEFVNQDVPPSVVWGRGEWWVRLQTSLPGEGTPGIPPMTPTYTPTPALPGSTSLPPATLPPATPPPFTPPPPSPIPECNPALPPRLRMGIQARVLPGTPNNLRERAGLGGAVIDTIPGGTILPITGGPFCDSGILWWIVNYNGQTGWTAEGQGTTYFLEPLP